MISIKNTYYSYPINKHVEKRPVFAGLSFDIKEGEFVSVLGRSGCGKTTLANILAGYLNIEEGKVLINNVEVKKPGKNRIVVNQENDLFEWMTVLENMRLVSDDNISINKYLKLVGLNEFKQDLPKNLSGGMKKRLSLARALAVNPKFLILDEPFASLDHRTREELHLELDHLFTRTKKTTLLVTHDIDEAVFLSDRILILGDKPTTIKKELRIDFPHPRKLNIKNIKKFFDVRRNIKKSYA